MAVIDTINVGGADYSIQDATARANANTALNTATEVKGKELYFREVQPAFYGNLCENLTNNTYKASYPAGYKFFWNSDNQTTADADWYPQGMSMITTKAVTAGTLIRPGTNCRAIHLSDFLSNVKTYVGSDGKIHFTDAWGADSALNFSGGNVNRPTKFSVHAWNGAGTSFNYLDIVSYPVTFTLTTLRSKDCSRARFGYLLNSPSDTPLGNYTFISVGTSVTIPANTQCFICLDALHSHETDAGELYAELSWS